MTGDVVVFDGVELTIEPGVVIEVAQNVKLEVRGRIRAVGTYSQNITFKGNAASLGLSWWKGSVRLNSVLQQGY